MTARRADAARRCWVAGVMVVVALAGCGGGSGAAVSEPAPSTSPGLPGPVVGGDVVVFAAASLTEAFGRIGADFEAAHPAATVTFSFGASSALAQQIASGAPADVFAAAAPAPMARVTDDGHAGGEPVVFARNRLQIAVPSGNPGRVAGLADFADPDLTIAVCAEQVPCGAAAVRAFRAAGVVPAPDTVEQDVRAALTKVELGEVDAALVYRTDVLAAGERVEGITFPEAERVVNDYPIVRLAEAPHPDGAQAFVDHVLSADGQRVLADAGFDSP